MMSEQQDDNFPYSGFDSLISAQGGVGGSSSEGKSSSSIVGDIFLFLVFAIGIGSILLITLLGKGHQETSEVAINNISVITGATIVGYGLYKFSARFAVNWFNNKNRKPKSDGHELSGD